MEVEMFCSHVGQPIPHRVLCSTNVVGKNVSSGFIVVFVESGVNVGLRVLLQLDNKACLKLRAVVHLIVNRNDYFFGT